MRSSVERKSLQYSYKFLEDWNLEARKTTARVNNNVTIYFNKINQNFSASASIVRLSSKKMLYTTYSTWRIAHVPVLYAVFFRNLSKMKYVTKIYLMFLIRHVYLL